MTVARLHEGAEYYLKVLDLTDVEKKSVRSMIQNYIRPKSCCDESPKRYLKVLDLTDVEGKSIYSTSQNYTSLKSCCEQLCWMIYRVVQAIKSLFGCSDWQKAKKAISNHIMSIFTEEKLILKEKSQKMASYLYSSYAEDMLKMALSAHEKKLAVSLDLKKVVKKLDIINLTRKQVKGYTVEDPD